MATPIPTSELAPALERRLTRLARVLRGAANRSGLSITALSTLSRLEGDEPCRITDLAAAEAVSQPTMTALVARLEARALVQRSADVVDRRAVRVSLTPAGRHELASTRQTRAQLLARRLDTLDDGGRAALAAALPALDHLLNPDRT